MKRILLFSLILSALLVSCTDKEEFSSDPTVRLAFSVDSVAMDTIFNNVPSRTYDFWVYNKSNSGVRIKEVRLNNPSLSGYRVNVDGDYVDSVAYDFEIRKEDSKLREMNTEDITSKDVFDAAMAGDKLAKEIFDYTGKILGEALADFTAFSAPEAFIIFGGLAKSGDLIMNPIKEAFEKNVLPLWRGKVKILFSEMKEADAAILGASALGWEVKED